jgi:hypothetical protein
MERTDVMCITCGVELGPQEALDWYNTHPDAAFFKHTCLSCSEIRRAKQEEDLRRCREEYNETHCMDCNCVLHLGEGYGTQWRKKDETLEYRCSDCSKLFEDRLYKHLTAINAKRNARQNRLLNK